MLGVKIMKRNVTRVGYIEVYISTTCSSLDGASREQLRTVMRVIVINAVTGNATSISNDIGEDQKLETRIEAQYLLIPRCLESWSCRRPTWTPRKERVIRLRCNLGSRQRLEKRPLVTTWGVVWTSRDDELDRRLLGDLRRRRDDNNRTWTTSRW